jgi:hypothetical protein
MQRPARHNQLFILIKFLSLIILPLQLVYIPVLFYELLVFHNVRADEILTLERLKKTGCTSNCRARLKALCSSWPSRAQEWPCSAWVRTFQLIVIDFLLGMFSNVFFSFSKSMLFSKELLISIPTTYIILTYSSELPCLIILCECK